MCREIGISDLIDEHCPSDSSEQLVSTGKALEAMILNGLGFVNKRLYLIPHFLDNNLGENSIRPIALGWKNYLFSGDHQAAQRAAIIYTLMASCKAQQINPWFI